MIVGVPLITTTTLSSFTRALTARGIPVDTLLRRRSLPTSWQTSSGDFVPYVYMREFLSDVARREGFPELGLCASHQSGRESIDPKIQAAVFGAPTLMHALQIGCQIAGHQSTHLRIWLEPKAECIRVCHAHAVGPAIPGYAIVEDHTSGLLLGLVRHYLGPRWHPARMVHRRRVPHRCQPTTVYAYPCDEIPHVLDDAHGGFDIPAELIWTPNRSPVDCAHRAATGSATRSTAATLRSLLRSYVTDGRPRIEFAADVLGSSVRALQRARARERTTFSEVLALAEFDVARVLMADEHTSLAEIAVTLGYSEQSAFTRAFRRWTGTTPRAYRKRLLRENGARPSESAAQH